MGFLINYDVYTVFYVDVIDVTLEGIMTVVFSNKITKFAFVLIEIYLSPRNNLYDYNVELHFKLSFLLVRFEEKMYSHCWRL